MGDLRGVDEDGICGEGFDSRALGNGANEPETSSGESDIIVLMFI